MQRIYLISESISLPEKALVDILHYTLLLMVRQGMTTEDDLRLLKELKCSVPVPEVVKVA